MAENDVHDSTDWLSTPLASLAALEGALRCQVCKDFFKTPMITACSHTFCSLCIRRALSNDGKCPLCRASQQELKLRSNWTLEETVEAFVKARPKALELARNAGSAQPKRKAEEDAPIAQEAPENKRLRTSARLNKTRVIAPPPELLDVEDEVVDVPDDDDYVPEPEDGLVPCPVCQNRMKEWQVFKHLESCPGPTPPPRQRNPGEGSSQANFYIREQTKILERLPAMNYSMLKETALRKKLAELGISNQGSRPLLEKRHKEWVTLWNANCDAVRPKKRGELLQDLEVWERTQGGRAPVNGRSAQNAAIIKDKDFDGAAWVTKHDTAFKDLIASARKSRMEAKRKAEEAARTEEAQPSSTGEPSSDFVSTTDSSVSLNPNTSILASGAWANTNGDHGVEDPANSPSNEPTSENQHAPSSQVPKTLSSPSRPLQAGLTHSTSNQISPISSMPSQSPS